MRPARRHHKGKCMRRDNCGNVGGNEKETRVMSSVISGIQHR